MPGDIGANIGPPLPWGQDQGSSQAGGQRGGDKHVRREPREELLYEPAVAVERTLKDDPHTLQELPSESTTPKSKRCPCQSLCIRDPPASGRTWATAA